MYTWGYIKTAALVKLDLEANSSISQGLSNKFFVYANEALTQICSSIKPKHTYASFTVVDRKKLIARLCLKYEIKISELSFLTTSIYHMDELTDNQRLFLADYNQYEFLNDTVDMPDDFIAFSGYASYILDSDGQRFEAFDEDYEVIGDKKVILLKEGTYQIAYDARWFTFTPTTDDNFELDIPNDILDCLPSYIVSQCFKIDDEVKSAIYRNEYEIFLARINDSVYMRNKTFKVAGGW